MTVWPEKRAFLFALLAMIWIALVYSKFALSVGMISIIAISFFNFRFRPPFGVRFNTNFFKAPFRSPDRYPYLAVLLYFFLLVLGFFYSEDMSYQMERFRIKIPFLSLPLAFLALPVIPKRYFHHLVYIFFWVITLTSLAILAQYLLNQEAVDAGLTRGQPMLTPISHIRFSLMVALSIVIGLYLIGIRHWVWSSKERYAVIIATIFLLLFIHVLAARSGILALYVALFVLLLRYAIMAKRYFMAGLGVALIALLPVMAYFMVPSFKNRIDYTMYDLKMYQSGTGQEYSDSERLISLHIGLQIFRSNPWFGIGPGDLRQEVRRIYAAQYPEHVSVKMPHNQFLSIMAGSGIVGLLLFLIAFLYPLFYRHNFRHFSFLGFYAIVLVSFLMENTIENAVGVAFFILMLLLHLRYLDGEEAVDLMPEERA